MADVYDASVTTELMTGMRLARAAVGRGELVVIPTDTVYGIAADAFTPRAVQRLLDAKGRTRQSPPPVLIPNTATLDALAGFVPEPVRDLVAEFWPGGLTIILRSQPSLRWDIGDTNGTVALRMPANPVALELLAETGPLAVSSANLTGRPAAETAAEAKAMLGDSVTVYLDGGTVGSNTHLASTIIDASRLGDDRAGDNRAGDIRGGDDRAGHGSARDSKTSANGQGGIRILRHGVISDEQLRLVVGDLLERDAAQSP